MTEAAIIDNDFFIHLIKCKIAVNILFPDVKQNTTDIPIISWVTMFQKYWGKKFTFFHETPP